MNITLSPQVNFGANLKPLSEYKGPILKLTKKEIAQIKILQDSATIHETEAYKLRNLYEHNKKNISLRNYYFYQLCEIETTLERLYNEIKNIKMKRLAIQKEKLIR